VITNSQPKPFSWRREVFTPAAVLLLITLALFWKIALTSEYSILSLPDNANQSYPWLQFAASEVRQGRLPLWNPYSRGGYNFLGEMQTAAFGPLQSLAYLAWPDAKGRVSIDVMHATILLGYWIASLLMYALCRNIGMRRFGALVGAVCFAFSGFLGLRAAQQSNVFFSAIWFPAIFLFFVRALRADNWPGRLAGAGLAGVALAFSLLSGHHHPGGLALLALAVTVLFRALRADTRRGRQVAIGLLLLALTAVAGLAIAGVQTFPTLEYSRHAVRWAADSVLPGERIGYETVGHDYILPPQNLLGFLSPVFEHTTDGTAYFGILGLVLAVIALSQLRRDPWIALFAVLAAASLLYAMGEFSIGHGLVNALLPGLDKLREASRALLITHFALAALAGFGAEAITERLSGSVETWVRHSMRVLAGLALGGTALLVTAAVLRKIVLEKPIPYSDFNGLVFMLLLLAFSWGTLAAATRRVVSRRVLCGLILAVVLFDLAVVVSSALLPKRSYDGEVRLYPKRYYADTQAVHFLRSREGLFRYYDPDRILPPNAGDVFRLQSVWGHGASAYYDYWKFFSGAKAGDPVLDLLNVRYILTRGQAAGWKEVWEDQAAGTRIFENPNMLPRAWMASRASYVGSLDDAITKIQSGKVNLRQEVLLGNSAGIRPSAAGSEGAQGTVMIEQWGPGFLRVVTDSATPGYLVLSEVNYPGWRAHVAGRTLKPWTADGVLMAFPTEAGRQNWEIRYEPASFRLGAAASLLSLVALATGCVLLARKQPDRWKELFRAGRPL